MNRTGTSCRPPKSPSSRRPPKPNKAASTCRHPKEEDLGNQESTGGVPCDTSIAISEGHIGANHSTTGDSTVVNPKRLFPRSDASYYENESVLLWSDDPEKEYFTYMLQKEQENRARKGKSAEDSLIGDSTLGEIQAEFAKWHEHGGEVILMEPDQGADDSSFPVAFASARKSTPGRQTLDGFSLATEEKSSPKQTPTQLFPPPAPNPAAEDKLFPNVIYVADSPETSVDMSKPSQGSSRTARTRNCFIFSLFFLGGLSLASAAVVIYMAHSSKDSNFANTTASLQGGGASNESPSPQGALRSSMAPSPSLSQAATFAPTAVDSATDISKVPTILPETNPTSSSDSTGGPTAIPTPALRLPAAGGGSTSEPTMGPTLGHKPFPAAPKASGGPTPNPTSKPTSKPTANPTPRPTFRPTAKPTPMPTTKPTSKPTERPSAGLTEACGCKHCKMAIERMADGFTCKERIDFLMVQRGYNELGACRLVAGVEFPSVCGPFCDPDKCDETTEAPLSSSNLDHPVPTSEATSGQPFTGHSEEIVWRGQDGEPKSAYPLGHCEGDCDSDSDCAPGLVCFERDGSWVAIPGCFAVTQEGTEISVCMLEEHLAKVRNQVNGDDFFPSLASKQQEVKQALEQP